MLCLRCGKKIPFSGDLCPFCKKDKSQSQLRYVVKFLSILLGLFFGYVGSLISGVGGALFGFFIGVIFTYIIFVINRKKLLQKYVTSETNSEGGNKPPKIIPSKIISPIDPGKPNKQEVSKKLWITVFVICLFVFIIAVINTDTKEKKDNNTYERSTYKLSTYTPSEEDEKVYESYKQACFLKNKQGYMDSPTAYSYTHSTK